MRRRDPEATRAVLLDAAREAYHRYDDPGDFDGFMFAAALYELASAIRADDRWTRTTMRAIAQLRPPGDTGS